ncbi:MAG: hypothetical protein ACRC6K_07665 [Fusobacteriaceae bacterium]
MNFDNWEENIYDTTFSTTYDAIINEFKNGEITLEQLEMNIEEHYIIMGNASCEGAARFQHCSALVDAHQFALTVIKKNLK